MKFILILFFYAQFFFTCSSDNKKSKEIENHQKRKSINKIAYGKIELGNLYLSENKDEVFFFTEVYRGLLINAMLNSEIISKVSNDINASQLSFEAKYSVEFEEFDLWSITSLIISLNTVVLFPYTVNLIAKSELVVYENSKVIWRKKGENRFTQQFSFLFSIFMGRIEWKKNINQKIFIIETNKQLDEFYNFYTKNEN